MDAIRESGRWDSVGEPSNRPWLEIVPFLSEPERRDFLKAYPVIDDERSRAKLLQSALRFLDVRMHSEWSAMLREAARSFQSKPIRAGMLATLVRYFDGPDRKATLDEALDAIRRIIRSSDRLAVVKQLVEDLDATERANALTGLLEATRAPGCDVDDPILERLGLIA